MNHVRFLPFRRQAELSRAIHMSIKQTPTFQLPATHLNESAVRQHKNGISSDSFRD